MSLRYGPLLQLKLIPELPHELKQLSTRRYPKEVYESNSKDSYDNILVSAIVSKIIGNYNNNKINSDTSVVNNICNVDNSSSKYSPRVLSQISDISNDICDKLNEILHISNLVCNDDNLICNGNTLIYVACTSKKDVTKIWTCSICKLASLKMSNLVLILALHKLVFKFDFSNFNFAPLRRELVVNVSIDKSLLLLDEYNIGCSTGYSYDDGYILTCIDSIENNSTSQIFLRHPTTGYQNDIVRSKLRDCREVITNKNIRLYIHSKLSINLCTYQSLTDIISDIKQATIIGAKGVVVHTGSNTRDNNNNTRDNTNNTNDEALNIMEDNIRTLLDYCTKNVYSNRNSMWRG